MKITKKHLIAPLMLLLGCLSITSCKGLFDDKHNSWGDGLIINPGPTHVTPEDVEVKEVTDLFELTREHKYILKNDIDCEGRYFKPIKIHSSDKEDPEEKHFLTIDGQGHTIRNLNIFPDSGNNCAGLIEYSEKTFIDIVDIKFDNLNMVYSPKGDNSNVNAGLLGGIVNTRCFDIDRVEVHGNLTVNLLPGQNAYIGGFVGFATELSTGACVSDIHIEVNVENINEDKAYNVGLIAGKVGNPGFSISSFINNNSLDFNKTSDRELPSNLSNINVAMAVAKVSGNGRFRSVIEAPKHVLFNHKFSDSALQSVNFYAGTPGSNSGEWSDHVIPYPMDPNTPNNEKLALFKQPNITNINGVDKNLSYVLGEEFMSTRVMAVDPFIEIEDEKELYFNLNLKGDFYNFGRYEGNIFIYPSLKMFD